MKTNGYIRVGYAVHRKIKPDDSLYNDKAFYKSIASLLESTGKYRIEKNNATSDYDVFSLHESFQQRHWLFV